MNHRLCAGLFLNQKHRISFPRSKRTHSTTFFTLLFTQYKPLKVEGLMNEAVFGQEEEDVRIVDYKNKRLTSYFEKLRL